MSSKCHQKVSYNAIKKTLKSMLKRKTSWGKTNDGKYVMTTKYNVLTFFFKVCHIISSMEGASCYQRNVMMLIKTCISNMMKLQSTVSCTCIIDRLIDIYLFQTVS